MVRSSGCAEGLEERGQLYSSPGTLAEVLQPLKVCLQKLLADPELSKGTIPLVVQKRVEPISAKGHLSNERFVSRENRDWLGEYEKQLSPTGKPFSINIRPWRNRIIIGEQTEKPLGCGLQLQISEILKIPAQWAYERGERIHFEWVWDEKRVYLVQADQERGSKGSDPSKIQGALPKVTAPFSPRCLKRINKSHARKYKKIRNVFTYIKLGLPSAALYVLDDQSVIAGLASGTVPPALESDLSELVKGALVIRTDISTRDKNASPMLPRTQTLFKLDDAIEWLKQNSAKMRSKTQEGVAFIFHNFVPAESAVFALAAPGLRKVQIEALWGVPEGLYYNAHDKYVVDTRNPNGKDLLKSNIGKFDVQSKLHFKNFFVSPNEDGSWTTKAVKPPFDWRGSIKKAEWVKQIALHSRRIAEEERRSLSIMWFVGVPKQVCPAPIFPWYHEGYDGKNTNRARSQRTKTPFDEELIVRNMDDFQRLQQEALKPSSRVKRVKIQPNEDALLRDKELLEKIGKLAKKLDAVILMEGGVLSHPYYQLIKTGATVEVLHPFDDFEDKQEFHKLVRDKVPANIERGGEMVRTVEIARDDLLNALKEKLVEEGLEVLGATDQDAIVGELADVQEIIDTVLSKLSVSVEVQRLVEFLAV